MTQRAFQLGLAVICAGLGAVLAAEVAVKAFTPSVSAASETAAPAPSEMPSIPDVDSMVAAILERPLFSASRLPYEETVEIAEVETGEEGPVTFQARLTGVAIRPEGREALFEREGSKPIAVKEGDEIDGWTVRAIRNDQVLLLSSRGEEILKMAYAPPRVRRPQQRVATSNAASKAPPNGAQAANGSSPAASDTRQARK